MRTSHPVHQRGVLQGHVAKLGAAKWDARPDEAVWPNLPSKEFTRKGDAEDYLIFGDGSVTPKWRQFEG